MDEFRGLKIDGITAVDEISQLRKKEDVLIALSNIRKSLDII